LFAAQAGAKKVFAIEGTTAADYARNLVKHSGYGDRIEVIQGRLEQVELNEKVDVIISEPWGFFLFHERMIEAFVVARDKFLRPGGRMYPSSATLYLAPFSDGELYDWRCQKVAFWHNKNFHGVDLSSLADTAYRELFEMPALGDFSPKFLVSSAKGFEFDFLTLPLDALGEMTLPFSFEVQKDELVHGLAGWFDVAFAGSARRVVLSTSPYEPCTHWAQMRFLFRRPIEMRAGQRLEGQLLMRANPQSSYDMILDARCVGGSALETQLFRLQSYYAWQNDD
jgi:histone-arginine methyltransferase CARM1